MLENDDDSDVSYIVTAIIIVLVIYKFSQQMLSLLRSAKHAAHSLSACKQGARGIFPLFS